MEQVKAFLIAHGEKVALVLVTLLVIWGVVDTMQVRELGIPVKSPGPRIGRIRDHLAKEEPVEPEGEVPRPAEKVSEVLNASATDYWTVKGWQTAYVLPPLPVTPPITKVLHAIPDPQFRPAVDKPSPILAKGRGRRIALVFRVGPRARWMEWVRAKVWRKKVGYAGQDVDKALVENLEQQGFVRQGVRPGERPERRERGEAGWASRSWREPDLGPEAPAGGLGPDPADAYPAGGLGPDPADAYPGGYPREPRRGYEPEPDMEFRDWPGPEERAEEPGRPEAEVEAERLWELEEERQRHLEKLLDKSTVSDTRWRLVAEDLQGLDRLPEGMGPVQFLNRLLAGYAPSPQEPEPRQAAYGQTRTQQELDPTRHKWFYLVEDAETSGVPVEENAIYRYRIALYGPPAPLPEALRERYEVKFKGYTPILRMGRQRLALLEDEFKSQREALDEPVRGARANQLRFEQLKPETGQNVEGNPAVWWSTTFDTAEAKMRHATEPGYSAFGFSEYFLTLVRTRIEFTGRLGEDTASITVVLTDRQGREHDARYLIQAPELSEAARGIPAVPERFHEKYSGVEPAPIGEPKRVRVQGDYREIDFSTGWGLVDIRDCEIVKRTVRYEVERNPDGTVKRNEEGEPQRKKVYLGTPIPQESQYLVVRELDPKGEEPRYRRILRSVRVSRNQEVAVEDWTPQYEEEPKEETETGEEEEETAQ